MKNHLVNVRVKGILYEDYTFFKNCQPYNSDDGSYCKNKKPL